VSCSVALRIAARAATPHLHTISAELQEHPAVGALIVPLEGISGQSFERRLIRSFRAEPRHGVFIDVSRDCLSQIVADIDGARIVHAAPNPGVVPVPACLCDAGIRAARLSTRRQGKRLSLAEVGEQNGRRRAILARMPGWVLYSGCEAFSRRPSGTLI
jgi:hypothetical protein